MGSRTKIDWCDATWNPVTGCLHGCEYCYARRIAERFGAMEKINEAVRNGTATDEIFFVDKAAKDKFNVFYHNISKINLGTLTGVKPEPCELNGRIWVNGKPNPYPFGFTPTFHRYRLDEPQHWKKPKTIFVCSMADLFGGWVPDEWIVEVFKACKEAPQHRYLFLTKNPKRYEELLVKGLLPINGDTDVWFGMSDTRAMFKKCDIAYPKTFMSIEPLLEEPFAALQGVRIDTGWVIIGAETGNMKDRIIPRREWIDIIVRKCREYGIPVFMKESLRGLMGSSFVQELPWEG